MRTSVLTAICLCLMFSSGMTARAEELKTFIEDVNCAWTNRNYSAIMSNINARLTINSNDVLALGLKMDYYVCVELDSSKAHAAAVSFSNAVHQTGREDLYPLADQMVSTVMAVEETNTYTAAQCDKIHTMFPDMFPSLTRSVFLYSKLAETNAP